MNEDTICFFECWGSRYPSIRNKSLITKREKLLNDRRQTSVLVAHSLFAWIMSMRNHLHWLSAYCVIVFVMKTWSRQHNVMDLYHDTECNTFTPIGVSVTHRNINCLHILIGWGTQYLGKHQNWPHATSWMTPRLYLLLTTHFLLPQPLPQPLPQRWQL